MYFFRQARSISLYRRRLKVEKKVLPEFSLFLARRHEYRNKIPTTSAFIMQCERIRQRKEVRNVTILCTEPFSVENCILTHFPRRLSHHACYYRYRGRMPPTTTATDQLMYIYPPSCQTYVVPLSLTLTEDV